MEKTKRLSTEKKKRLGPRVSFQHGKHRHVSKNTITPADFRGYEEPGGKPSPVFKLLEPGDKEIRSTRPSLLKRIWGKIFK